MNESPNPQAAGVEAPATAVMRNTPTETQRPSSWFGRMMPSLFVFMALGGTLLWGHHTGWTLPKFSALWNGAPEHTDDWCEEHNVPESQCVECNPALMPRPKVFGWCKLHGVHECPLCHPEISHTTSRQTITTADFAKAKRALDFAERPENNRKCKLYERRIQFVSAEAVTKAGIDVEPVWTAPMIEAVNANGEITYDQTHTARLSARVPGTVFQVYKKTGDHVVEGEALALVDAAEVGKAKSEFLKALVEVKVGKETLERLAELFSQGAYPLGSYKAKEAALSEAKIRLTAAQEAMTNLGLPVDVQSLHKIPQENLADRLRFLGLPEPITSSLDPKKTTGNLLAVTAPFKGVVVARQVVAGEVVDNHKALFMVVDVRQMWLTLDLRVEDAKRVALGQEVRFRPDGGPDAKGKIAWISTDADQKTRTVKVRAILENSKGQLRANTFGTGQIVLREESQAIVVPNSAVHWEGCCHIVFVRDKDFLKEGTPKVFHVRTVRPGVKDDKHTEIIVGALPGEVVATKGSAALRAELLRGKLGEG